MKLEKGYLTIPEVMEITGRKYSTVARMMAFAECKDLLRHRYKGNAKKVFTDAVTGVLTFASIWGWIFLCSMV